ncbi:MAG: hypothetical protein KIS96_13755 [Bauldia sp.]|nr:hypothetical protein [Bauldia sp.]
MNGWRTGRTVLLFALGGPLIGGAIFLALFVPAIRNLGPFQSTALLDLAFGAYIVGTPPMIATGLLVAALGRRGRRLPTLTLIAAAAGFLLGMLSAFLWSVLGTPVSDDGAGVPIQLLLGIGVLAAAAAFICTILAGILAHGGRSESEVAS